ncbi:hypothetical protein M3N64_08095 [Sporolactobacillus sp. CPB3-1]|uniref:DUF4064 domain-containing protein n=1 Tax=Sporolactobacillus mangiferae TaxID=2940498 RepID=A0ABT0MAM0_9BACL|nr:hypothetical protein [Sporolactobacillus mangiferae]MCL1631911.1 hypothetical protein [Sporolactobacillus mangiferae]
MIRHIFACVISVTGIAMTCVQMIFGAFTYVATLLDSRFIDHLQVNADLVTAHGAENSLQSFGCHAFIAGIVCFSMSLFALYYYVIKKQRLLSGLCFLLAGSLNCLILFGSGLPAGVMIIAAGVAVMAGKADMATPKPPIAQ